VIKLAAQLGAAMFAAKRDDACERFLVLVGIKPEIGLA